MFAARPWSAMRRLPGLIVLVLALAIPAVGATAAPSAPQPTADAAKTRTCRTPFTETRTAQGIQVAGIGCKDGVKVAIVAAARAPSGCVKVSKSNRVDFIKPCVRLRFRCKATPFLNGKVLKAICKRGSATVRFQY